MASQKTSQTETIWFLPRFDPWSGEHLGTSGSGKGRFCIYFADPYSSWQRGSNENTNGLIRQYFPKGTDSRDITNKDLAFVVKKLNYRPRKCLNYQTPHEIIYGAIHGALATGIEEIPEPP